MQISKQFFLCVELEDTIVLENLESNYILFFIEDKSPFFLANHNQN